MQHTYIHTNLSSYVRKGFLLCPLDEPHLVRVSLPGNNIVLQLGAFPIREVPSLQQIEYERRQ
jgi:hypothetical protein